MRVEAEPTDSLIFSQYIRTYMYVRTYANSTLYFLTNLCIEALCILDQLLADQWSQATASDEARGYVSSALPKRERDR